MCTCRPILMFKSICVCVHMSIQHLLVSLLLHSYGITQTCICNTGAHTHAYTRVYTHDRGPCSNRSSSVYRTFVYAYVPTHDFCMCIHMLHVVPISVNHSCHHPFLRSVSVQMSIHRPIHISLKNGGRNGR